MARNRSKTDAYKFKGRAVEGSGRTIEAAINELADLWNGRPSLVMHSFGAMRIDIVVAGRAYSFDLTDPSILDAAEEGRFGPLYDWMAKQAGISSEDIKNILDKSTDVNASVDRIRPPSDPTFWKPDLHYEPSAVLPRAVEDWAGGLALELTGKEWTSKKERQQSLRFVELITKAGIDHGKSYAQIAEETGLPRSTVRDAKTRADRRAKAALSGRKPRARLSEDDRDAVANLYAVTKNAAEVGRKLGISDRTVRDIVKSKPERVASVSKSELLERLLSSVSEGSSASAAGRDLGIPERTAREWVSKNKRK